MANTDVVKQLSEDGGSSPEKVPSRSSALALAAVDEAFQDNLKNLFVVLWDAQVRNGDDGFAEQLPRTQNGIAIASKVRVALRRAITAAENPPDAT